MIIDNLKEFIAKFTDTHSTNDDCKEENKNLEELCVDVDSEVDVNSKEEEPLLGDIDWEVETESGIDSLIEEPLGGIPTLDPDADIDCVYGPSPDDEILCKYGFCPDDEIDEPTPCVYGPPSWYDDNGNLDPDNPDAKRFIDEIDAIEERNRWRAELRKLRQMEIQDSLENKSHPLVYGPKPR